MGLGWNGYQSDPVTAQEEALPLLGSFFPPATVPSGEDQGAFQIDTEPRAWSLMTSFILGVLGSVMSQMVFSSLLQSVTLQLVI